MSRFGTYYGIGSSKRVFIFALSVLLLYTTSCAEAVQDVEEIVGTYALERASGSDRIELLGDGTYTRNVCTAGSCENSQGQWEVKVFAGEPRVVLSNFHMRWDTYGSGRVDGWATYAYGPPFRRLVVNDDLGIEYGREP